MGISVVLLAYKEAENLSFLLPKIKGFLDELPEEYEILVIDTKEPLDILRRSVSSSAHGT